MATKSKKSLLIPLCLAVLSAAAAVLFVLPQFSRTAMGGNPLGLNGFKLAFGFKDIAEIPGRFYFFFPFVFGILNAIILLALPFIKALKDKAKPVYLAAASLALISLVLFIVYLATAKNIDAGSGIIHNYYFKNIMESSSKDILRGGFTVWFWFGAVFHLLCLGGCCFGAVKES